MEKENESKLSRRSLSKFMGYSPTKRIASIAYKIITKRQNENNFIIPKGHINFGK